jgi:4-amino-4-deoxy-L-arabinose transferase-like glycosyltransferase
MEDCSRYQEPVRKGRGSGPRLTVAAQRPATATQRTGPRSITLALFFASFGVRALHLYAQRNSPLFRADRPPWDAYYYTHAAWGLASGQGWTPELAYVSSPPYVLFLTGCFALFGRDVWMVRLIQAGLGALTPVFLHSIGRQVFDQRVGLVAGLLAAFYAPFVFYEGELLKPWAAVWTSCVVLLSVLQGAPEARAARLLGAGVLLALLIQLRGNLALFVPWALLWVAAAAWATSSRRAWIATAWFVAGLGVVHGSYLARGLWMPPGKPVFSEGVGIHFYIGNHAGASGTYTEVTGIRPTAEGHVVDAARIASLHTGRLLHPAEVSRYWLRQGLAWVWAEPADFLALSVRKIALFLNAYEIPSNEDFYFSRQFSWVLRLPLVGFGAVCPLALLGISLRARHFNREELLLVGFLACGVSSLVGLFVTSSYRLATVPVLMIFAAYALVWLFDRARERRGLALAAGWSALAGLTVAVNMPEFLSRDVYERKAEAQLRAALAEPARPASVVSPPAERENAPRTLLEARQLVRLGRLDAARALLERAVAAGGPGSARLRLELSDLLERAGDVPSPVAAQPSTP